MSATISSLEPRIGCIAAALNILGQKWTALIIRDLYDGPKRFSALERSVQGINPRTLSQRLSMLETHGIIYKISELEYALSDKGRDLVPVIRDMAAWGDKYRETCA